MIHVLVRLSTQINWERLAGKIESIYSERGGQPPLPTRLLVGLHHLKYAFNESDESVVSRRVKNPYWQYFCGVELLQHERPPRRWENGASEWGQKRLESLLIETILVAQETGPTKYHHVNVDTTVQQKTSLSQPMPNFITRRAGTRKSTQQHHAQTGATKVTKGTSKMARAKFTSMDQFPKRRRGQKKRSVNAEHQLNQPSDPLSLNTEWISTSSKT